MPGGPRVVELRRPGLAGYLDRSDIVLGTASYRVQVNSQTRWSEPLGDMIGRVLSQDLGQRLPGSTVFTEQGSISADPDAQVEVDIHRFDADAGGAVSLTAEIAIERGHEHVPLSSGPVDLTAQPSGPGAASLVATMSTLLGSLAHQIAADLRSAPIRVGAKS